MTLKDSNGRKSFSVGRTVSSTFGCILELEMASSMDLQGQGLGRNITGRLVMRNSVEKMWKSQNGHRLLRLVF